MVLAASLLVTVARAQDLDVPVSLRSDYFSTSDGVRLHVLEGGRQRAGQPVLAFVPGWSMPATMWRAQLLALGQRYRVAALDPRGQGASDVPRTGFHLDRRAQDIHEFVLRYPRVVLVTWSLAALETLHLLSSGQGKAVASRLAGFAIVDSSVGEGPDPTPTPTPSGSGFVAELRNDRPTAVEGFVRAIFKGPYYEPALLAVRDAALRIPLEDSIALFPSHKSRAYWREAVHAIKLPLLYAYTPQFEAQAIALREKRPLTRLEAFPDAGHALFVDEADKFNAVLGEFVRSLRPSSDKQLKARHTSRNREPS